MNLNTDRLVDLVEAWRGRLNLENWEIRWTIETGSPTTYMAQTEVGRGAHAAFIRFNQDKIQDYEDLRLTVIHELLHLLWDRPFRIVVDRMDDAGVLAKDAQALFNEIYVDEFEISLADTTEILSRHYKAEDERIYLKPKRKKRK